MATVKESVAQALLGTTEDSELSQQTRQNFLQHAKKDPETGEMYMGEDEFINAVAPKSEDYVSVQRAIHWSCGFLMIRFTAQNQALTIRHPLPRRGPSKNRASYALGLEHVCKPPCEA